MARVDFYHLTRDPAPLVLARLAERVLASGDRLLVVSGEREISETVDAALWAAIPESFLAHMPAGSPLAEQAHEPVILADNLELVGPSAPSIVALADGQWRDEALGFARTLFLFDGSRIDEARAAWRSLSKREGISCHYWKQDDAGRWKEGP